jgi:hypothetical protein
MTEVLIAKRDTFTKAGRYVYRGQPISADELDEEGREDVAIDAPEGVDGTAVVEISAIAPTGPNPQNPQQIPNDAHQVPGGYAMHGAKLVGEVTVPEKQRIEIVGIDPEDDTQAKVTEALAEADQQGGRGSTTGNADDSLVDGTVADVTGRITSDTSEEELARLEAAENDREKPRAGVLNALKAERERRAAAEETTV